MADVQERPEVAQARAELDNALREGNADAERAARKRLAAAGVDSERRQRAAQSRKAAAEESDDDPATARATRPTGRSSKESKADRT